MSTITVSKKYELTNENHTFEGITVHRIRALRDFDDVKAGQLGGFIESENNPSHDGNCWVYDNAGVFCDAIVSENAKIRHDAIIAREVKVYGNAVVCDKAWVFGKDASIYDNAKISNNARVCGYVYGNSHVYGKSRIYGGGVYLWQCACLWQCLD